jgi:hypothetical protein
MEKVRLENKDIFATCPKNGEVTVYLHQKNEVINFNITT